MSALTIEILLGFKELDEARKQIVLDYVARMVKEQREEDLEATG